MTSSQPTIWLTERSEVITDTIRPPTMMLMVTIAAGPDDADDAIEAALQLGLVEFGDAPGEHRQLTGLLAQAQHAHRHGGKRRRYR